MSGRTMFFADYNGDQAFISGLPASVTPGQVEIISISIFFFCLNKRAIAFSCCRFRSIPITTFWVSSSIRWIPLALGTALPVFFTISDHHLCRSVALVRLVSVPLFARQPLATSVWNRHRVPHTPTSSTRATSPFNLPVMQLVTDTALNSVCSTKQRTGQDHVFCADADWRGWRRLGAAVVSLSEGHHGAKRQQQQSNSTKQTADPA